MGKYVVMKILSSIDVYIELRTVRIGFRMSGAGAWPLLGHQRLVVRDIDFVERRVNAAVCW